MSRDGPYERDRDRYDRYDRRDRYEDRRRDDWSGRYDRCGRRDREEGDDARLQLRHEVDKVLGARGAGGAAELLVK